jgi:phage recombination protein Bet
MTSAIAVREQPQGGALAMWDAEQLDIITKLICPDANPAELALFGQVCQRTGLDPFAKQIYAIKQKGRMTIQTGIDGFRLQADRSRDYAGQEGPQWCGEDGVWRDVWLSKEPPAAARVGVYRKGWTRPVWGVATWVEYAQVYNGQPTEMWARMPSNQLAKCAEAQALRKAFPAELSGLYAKEEMDQAENPTPIQGELVPPATAPTGWSDALRRQWGAGCKALTELGLEVPQAPPDDAAREQIQDAIRTIAARVTARKDLLAKLAEVISAANTAGIDAKMPPDIATWTAEMIDDWIARLQEGMGDDGDGDLEGLPA